MRQLSADVGADAVVLVAGGAALLEDGRTSLRISGQVVDGLVAGDDLVAVG